MCLIIFQIIIIKTKKKKEEKKKGKKKKKKGEREREYKRKNAEFIKVMRKISTEKKSAAKKQE